MDDNVARAIGRVFREGPRVVQLIIASNMVCLYALDDPSAYGTSRWKHDWRRTLTSAFAHADESHLLGNMSVLAVVGPVVYMAVRQRTSSWLLIYFVALVTAELSSVAYRQWMRDDAYSVGASGAISGMIAALGVLRPLAARRLLGARTDLHPLVQIVLNCLVDFVSSIRSGRNIDIAGHAGGAIGGLCVAYALKRLQ